MPAGFAISTHAWKPAPLVYSTVRAVPDPKAKLKKTFRDLDVNHDGRLTFHELKRLLQKGQPGMGDHEMRVLFKHVDRDRSGLIEFDEFVDFIFSGALEDPEEDHTPPLPVAGHHVDVHPLPAQQALQQALQPAAAATAPAALQVAAAAPQARSRSEHPGTASSQQSRRASKDSSGPRRPPQLMSRTPSKESSLADAFGVMGRKADLHTPTDSPLGARGPQRAQAKGSAGSRSKDSLSPADSSSGGARRSVIQRRGPAARSQSPGAVRP